jgi:hypothetical protein
VSLNAEFAKLSVVESVTSAVIKPEALPGIDISPLIDALMQFLLQLLEDCPKQDIRRAAEQSARRPLLRQFWRVRLNRKLPAAITDQLPDAAGDLLAAGISLTDAEWSAL